MSNRNLLVFSFQLILFTLIAVLLYHVKNFMAVPTDSLITTINQVSTVIDDQEIVITLPYQLSLSKSNDPIVFSTTVTPSNQDVLYVESESAPLRIYADGNLIYEMGQSNTYPDFMSSPPSENALISLPYSESEGTITLQLEFIPTTSTLTIAPLYLGDHTLVIRKLIENMGFSLLLSVIQLLVGVLLMIVSLLIITYEKEGIVFFWLGLFSLASGAWAFGSCDLAGIFITNHTLLYLFTYIGFFILAIPMISFVMSVVNFKNPNLLFFAILTISFMAIMALWLQFLGIIPFTTSVYLFYILVPSAAFLLAWCTVWDALRYTSIDAARLALPITVLATTAFLETLNYEVPITYLTIPIFQLGSMFFICSTAVLGGLYIRDVFSIRNQKQQLVFQMNLMQYQLEDQKKQSALIANNAELLKQQRHDLKHQLTVMQLLNEKEEHDELSKYLDSLLQKIPAAPILYCENETVNAVISHYATLCEQHHIKFSTKLVIPPSTDQTFNSDLCSILGNLLENALEACNRCQNQDKFIRIHSRLKFDTLTITMDNSFSGGIRKINGKYYSQKRNDFGVGLSSITSVAQKYQGDASFDVNGNKFLSSVYLNVK